MTAVPSRPALGPGSRLGPYEIIAPLRAGGMATLFLGRRVGPRGFARHVAIKVVHAHLASDPGFVDMFLDEARLAARIQHPNVVHTEELGEEDGTYFLAMEYVHGCSLAQFLMRLIQQNRGLAPEVAVHIAMKVADGLHAAHEVKDDQGKPLAVVHRDVSPQNVLLAYDGQVKLIDFGVAKTAAKSRETTGTSLKGKIRYMAPEQAWGRAVDRRTDVYALAIVLWEALTHRRLFVADDDFAALERVRSPVVAAPSTHAQWIASGLDTAVLTALAVDPAARFQTAQAFRRALGGCCPKAVAVEPDDLGALLVSVMEEDIERERRSAPPTVTPALEIRAPEQARRTGAMAAYTREMPAYVPPGNEALTAAEVPSARATSSSAPESEPGEDSHVRMSDVTPVPSTLPGYERGRGVMLLFGLSVVAIVGVLAMWLLHTHRASSAAPVASPPPAPHVAPAPPAPAVEEVPVAPPPAPVTDRRPRGRTSARPSREPVADTTEASVEAPVVEAPLAPPVEPAPPAAEPPAPAAPAAPVQVAPAPITPRPLAPSPLVAPRLAPRAPPPQ
jgi:serine/threonine protein kinase